MKTTIDIPDQELRDVLRFTGARTKRDAINAAVAEFNRRQRVEEVIKQFGTFPDFPTNEEIEADQMEAEAKRTRDLD